MNDRKGQIENCQTDIKDCKESIEVTKAELLTASSPERIHLLKRMNLLLKRMNLLETRQSRLEVELASLVSVRVQAVEVRFPSFVRTAEGIDRFISLPPTNSRSFFEELVAEAVRFIFNQNAVPNFNPPPLSGGGSYDGKCIEREDTLKVTCELILARWNDIAKKKLAKESQVVRLFESLCFHLNSAQCLTVFLWFSFQAAWSRVHLAVISSGPGGGKSYFVDQLSRLSDVLEVRSACDEFRADLKSSLRLAVSFNDKMPLTPPQYGSTPEVLLCLRVLFSYYAFLFSRSSSFVCSLWSWLCSYVVPFKLFQLNAWGVFVDTFLDLIPVNMKFQALMNAVVAHYVKENKDFNASKNKLVLFGLDEPMKLEDHQDAMQAMLLPVAQLQDVCGTYEFIPFVTSLSQAVMDERVKTSGRQLAVRCL